MLEFLLVLNYSFIKLSYGNEVFESFIFSFLPNSAFLVKISTTSIFVVLIGLHNPLLPICTLKCYCSYLHLFPTLHKKVFKQQNQVT